MQSWNLPSHLVDQCAAHKAMLEHLITEFGTDMIFDHATGKPKTLKVGIFGSV